MTRFYTLLLIVILSESLTGCGSGLELAPVRGKVVVDGQPYADAKVISYPDDGPVAAGLTDEQGEFELTTVGDTGALTGPHTLTVSPNVTEPTPVPGRPIEILKVPYDSKFRSRRGSTLKYEVAGGVNLTIDLTAGTISTE